MLDDLLPLLDSVDPQTRQQAIRQLANLRDAAALPHLARLYRTDTNPAVRDLALKAGAYIRQAAEGAPAALDEPLSEEIAVRQPLTARERDMARSLLDTATGFAVERDPGRALDYLGRAVAIDPDLVKEPFATNLVLSLTGLSVNQALPVLIHPDRRAALIEQVGGKRKLKTVQPHGKGAESATWDRVLLDFAVYFALMVVGFLALFVIVFTVLQDMVDEYGMTGGTMYNTGAYSNSTQQIDDIVAASFGTLIVAALAAAVGNTMGLAINGAAIHAAATYIFGGTGTLVYLFRRFVPFNTLVMGIMIALAVLIAIFDSPLVMLVSLGLGSIGAALIIIYFEVKIISEVYAFGMGAGCGSLLIAGVLMFVLQMVVQWVISGVLNLLM